MTVSITVKTSGNGDYEGHVSGCSHLNRTSGSDWDRRLHVFAAAETVLDAIIAADTDMARWFCCTPYTEKSRDDGCWAFNSGVVAAPCLKKLMTAAKIKFDADGRPYTA